MGGGRKRGTRRLREHPSLGSPPRRRERSRRRKPGGAAAGWLIRRENIREAPTQHIPLCVGSSPLLSDRAEEPYAPTSALLTRAGAGRNHPRPRLTSLVPADQRGRHRLCRPRSPAQSSSVTWEGGSSGRCLCHRWRPTCTSP
jgi:hypothetical protein